MKAAIIGASAGVGRSIAEQLAQAGASLLLVASDQRDLAALRSDLLLMNSACAVSIVALDLSRVAPGAVVDAIRQELGRADVLFFVAGLADPADSGALESAAAEQIVRVNFVAPVLLINEVVRQEILALRGTIAVVSSVAAARARGQNVVYGAAKRGLEQYLAALRMSRTGMQYRTVVYRLGYVDTGMMQQREALLPKASAESVARRIIAGLDGRRTLRYVPAWWWFVALIVRVMPAAVLRWVNI